MSIYFLRTIASIVLAIGGIVLSWIGGKILLNKSPAIEHDSAVDKWLFSSYTRYFLGRYYAGGQLLAAGVFFSVVAFIIYISK